MIFRYRRQHVVAEVADNDTAAACDTKTTVDDAKEVAADEKQEEQKAIIAVEIESKK